MGPLGIKRARPESTNPVTKKRKMGHKVASKAVALDMLPWSEVAFPERFDDAEGFFGLEEISDVDVVKNEKLGKVEYRIASKEEKPSRPGGGEKGNGKPEIDDIDAVVEGYGEEEEWEGFEDAETKENGRIASSLEESKAMRKVRRDEAKNKARLQRKIGKKAARKESGEDAKEPQGNAFAALDEEEDEEGDISTWDGLDLSSKTLSALSRLKFTMPTPIQKAAIPKILDGHDVIGKASTGSGKTLAFAIPIYEHCLKTKSPKEPDGRADKDESHVPAALILSPTRELAHQLSTHMKNLCSSDVSIATITGGLSVLKQQRLLAYADVIIGTPGRLWEVLNGDKGLIDRIFKAQFLILDEADRLLSEGHFKEVEEILHVLDRRREDDVENDDDENDEDRADNPRDHRQTLIFSATFQEDLQQKLAGKSRFSGNEVLSKRESMEYLIKKINFREGRPQFIDVNPVSQMASNLKESVVECAGLEKDLYLYATLLLHPNTRTLIFTNSIKSVRRLLPFLQNLNVNVYALHSQMPQKARLRSIERFSSPSSPSSILIATDVAARGLDIPAVDLIVHYHVPRAADMYVHRSGRTARAERSGQSILLCAPEEVQGVRRLVAKVHARHALNHDVDDKKFFMRTLELDRRIVAKLKPRVTLSKKIADAGLAKEKKGHEDNWLKTAAEDLGVEYDSEEFAAGQGSKKGRGQGRMKRERESRGISKGELGVLRAELREELGRRVNVGVSERYLTAGGVDIDELLAGSKGDFIGTMGGRMDD